MATEWGIRKTKKFISQKMDEINSLWSVRKVTHVRGAPYHIIYAGTEETNGYLALRDAIRTMAEIQRTYGERFTLPDTPRPKPVVLSFVIHPTEEIHMYPYRLSIMLPPWDFRKRALLGKDAVEALATREGYVRVGERVIPVLWRRKADEKIKFALEQTMARHNTPIHVANGNIDEAAAAAVTLRESPDWAIARNVLVTTPSNVKQHAKKNMGKTITELDFLALGTNGKRIHVGEVKGVGPATASRWDEIVTRKAITLTPAMQLFMDTMGPRATRLFPHFLVVSTREEVSTELANAALKMLKPTETFKRLEAHAIWPSGKTLLVRKFREPLW